MKRLMDVIVSIVGLALFLPFGVIIALLLRFTGEGEVFYRQRRVGRGGRVFHLLKFATMLRNSPSMSGGSITVRNDPRVLPLGRFLRKTKINEIPQLWNVLIGEMSIVGPRPLTEETFAYYPAHAAAVITSMRPGITGIGSIAFRDEEAVLAASRKSARECYKEDISPRKAALEVWYSRHQSFWVDLMLVLFTIPVVVRAHTTFYERWFPDLPRDPIPSRPAGRVVTLRSLWVRA